MICDYNHNTFKYHQFGSLEKICQTRSHTCGGPPTPPNSSLPQYLAIGDSITYGQFKYLYSDLKDMAEAHLVTRNVGPTGEGRKCIDIWVGEDLERWDVISYNFGAWDTARQPSGAGGTPLPTYVDNLRNITEILMKIKAGRNGKLIYVLTTPSANIKACCPANKSSIDPVHGLRMLSCPLLIRQYNDAAVKLVSSYTPKITVDNLWSWVNEHCCGSEDCWFTSCDFQPEHGTCNVHFDGDDGWEYLAKNVSATVKELLKG